MHRRAHRRILALDIHPLRVGVAVLEGPARLITFSTLRLEKKVDAVGAAAHLAPRLIARCLPDRVVITLPANQTLARQRIEAAKRIFADAAGRAGIPVSDMPRRKYLRALGVATRYAAALQMADRFPALAARLPRRRKVWEAEPPSMAVFDAVAAGVARFLLHRHRRTTQAAA